VTLELGGASAAPVTFAGILPAELKLDAPAPWRMFSSQRMLSLSSTGTGVGLIFFLRAAVPLNFCRVQNLMAAKPKVSPSVVTTKLECISNPRRRVHPEAAILSLPLLTR